MWYKGNITTVPLLVCLSEMFRVQRGPNRLAALYVYFPLDVLGLDRGSDACLYRGKLK
jgi:hypothetical protein